MQCLSLVQWDGDIVQLPISPNREQESSTETCLNDFPAKLSQRGHLIPSNAQDRISLPKTDPRGLATGTDFRHCECCSLFCHREAEQLPGEFIRLIRGGLLLGHAMNRAEPPHQIGTGDTHHLAHGEEILQCCQCSLVVRAMIGGHQHCVIGDIKVGIAGWETIPLVLNGGWHTQGHDAKWTPMLIRHFPQPFQVVLERTIVDLGGVFFDRTDDGRRIDEAGDVVNVTIGVVSHNPVTQPENVRDAEIGAEIFLDIGATEGRITVGVQKTGFRSQQRAVSININ